MAEKQKGKNFAFGGKSSTAISWSNEESTPSTATLNAVIESLSPVVTADKTEMRDGNGDVDGLIYTNLRTTLQIEFYVSESSIAISENMTNTAIQPGHSFSFSDTTFAEINSTKFVIDEVTKMRNFGEVRKVGVTMTKYEVNDVSADATAI